MKRSLPIIALIFLIVSNQLFGQTGNLLAYFPFNGNANDESGNGNHGTEMGAILTEDRFGNDSSAYSFNGVDNYIGYPTLYGSSPGALTMMAWFITYSLSTEGKILYHGNNGEFQLVALSDSLAAGSVHLGTVLSGGWHIVHGSIEPNNWNFIAVIWKQSEKLKLYVNGIWVDSIDVIPGPLLDVGGGYQPSIGSYNQTGGGYFKGAIDDIRIYNSALTNGAIDSLFYEGMTAVEEVGSAVPQTFELAQNYPNPFNPSTKIRYSISTVLFVQLIVCDILGNEIATLVNGEQSAGNYRVDFDGTKLTSGIYFYRLQTENFVETKKMILLK